MVQWLDGQITLSSHKSSKASASPLFDSIAGHGRRHHPQRHPRQVRPSSSPASRFFALRSGHQSTFPLLTDDEFGHPS
jgi:hypothetical protein